MPRLTPPNDPITGDKNRNILMQEEQNKTAVNSGGDKK
jgi:hypothetical protein